MPTFNTDFIMYDSVYEPSTVDYSENQIDAINSLDGNIAGLGPVTQLGLRYTTSNLGIPLNATILGFDIRIRNRINAGSGIINNRFITNTVAPDGSNSPFDSSQGIISQDLTSTTFNNYILGYSTTSGETGIRPDSQQTVPLIDLIANDNLCLLLTSLSIGESPFQNIRFGNNIQTSNLPSIGLKIYYETPELTKVKISSVNNTISGRNVNSFKSFSVESLSGQYENGVLVEDSPFPLENDNTGQAIFTDSIFSNLPSTLLGSAILGFGNIVTGPEVDGTLPITSLGNIDINTVTSIKATVVYDFLQPFPGNFSRFKMGFGSFSATIPGTILAAETEFNSNSNVTPIATVTLDETNGLSNYLSTISTLALGALIINYTDDDPDNALNVYGQSFNDPSGTTGVSQVSPFFEISYGQSTKVKIKAQPDIIDDDLIIPGLKTKVILK